MKDRCSSLASVLSTPEPEESSPQVWRKCWYFLLLASVAVNVLLFFPLTYCVQNLRWSGMFYTVAYSQLPKFVSSKISRLSKTCF